MCNMSYYGESKIDREKVCPLLLRVFTKSGGHHSEDEFRGSEPVKDEVQIYTWKNASLHELTQLIKGVRPMARRKDAKLSFAFVYPDKRGLNVLRTVGQTFSSRSSQDDKKTLQTLKFETGRSGLVWSGLGLWGDSELALR